ncbi:uncharacterized protein LOC119326415 [Triticum dicoccoides]|uniref:uncharacterized protein LOC119326415 n=1 Tax=Triticum dicoccoides TaxID=85692 RepID=UPI001890E5E3|nr:uncharacterized protein LOC119326415 [Triticum dicoccoides]
MLHLRCCILARLRSSPDTSHGSYLHRAISAAAAAAPVISPNPSFAVEEYLVATCGLTPAQALKASAKLSHLKSPAKPDAVLSFLAGHGFSSSDVAAVVTGDPKVLCSSVEGYLGPVVAQLTGLGLSRSQIARLISYCHGNLHLTSIVSKLQYYLPLFGSIDSTLRALKRGLYLISSDLERVVKPNVAALHDSGLGDCDIAKLCLTNPWLLTTNVESIRAILSCAESLGVPRGSRMFMYAVHAVVFLGEEKIAAKLGYLKKTFRCRGRHCCVQVSNLAEEV